VTRRTGSREGLGRTAFTPYVKEKEVEGERFAFYVGDRDGREWYDLQATDPLWREMRLLRDLLLKPGQVVLEVGAHHGCTAILLSRWVGAAGRVIVFEPLPQNVAIVERNIALNRLANVEVVSGAVGASRGQVLMNDESSNGQVIREGLQQRGVHVPMVTLDDYIDRAPDLLKIDCEGFEIEVLRGASQLLRERQPALHIEVHASNLRTCGQDPMELFDILDAHGRWRMWTYYDEYHHLQSWCPGDDTPPWPRFHLLARPDSKA
jgi:FkbM family methyltransferase